MHVHEVTFEVVNRQAIAFETDDMGHISDVQAVGAPRGPEAWETGLKDTVIAYPGEVTRLRAKFDTPGTFVWHCHIVEHEDNEMMRPTSLGPNNLENPAVCRSTINLRRPHRQVGSSNVLGSERSSPGRYNAGIVTRNWDRVELSNSI
jgi:hypothetical protein